MNKSMFSLKVVAFICLLLHGVLIGLCLWQISTNQADKLTYINIVLNVSSSAVLINALIT